MARVKPKAKEPVQRAGKGSSSKGGSNSKKKSAPKQEKKKRGNQGNFHGEALEFLQSHFAAYMAASGKKKGFWDDFFPAWDRKFPPLALEKQNASSSKKPLNALVGDYGSDGDNSETEEPSAYFERSVSRAVRSVSISHFIVLIFCFCVQVLKRWFSTRMTKERAADRNPFDKYLAQLNTQGGVPRQLPVEKFYMKFSDSAQEVEAEYQKRFGPGSGGRDGKDDEEVGSKSDERSEDGVKDAAVGDDGDGRDGEGAGSKGKGKSKGPIKDAAEGSDDGSDGEGEDEEENPKGFALSRRVTIAKELFSKKSPQAQAAIRKQAEEHHASRKAAYEKALLGEDWYDADLLPEYVPCTVDAFVANADCFLRRRKHAGTFAQPFADSYGSMVKGIVSVCVVGLDEPGNAGEEPSLFLHQ